MFYLQNRNKAVVKCLWKLNGFLNEAESSNKIVLNVDKVGLILRLFTN